MKRTFLIFVATLSLSLGICGCKASDDELSDETPAVSFEGKPDPRFASVWKTQDGNSTYNLALNGDFSLKGKVKTPGGMFDNNVKGKWAVKNDLILFQYNGTDVVPYKYSLAGSKLTLTLTGKMKRSTVLVKQ